MNQYAKVSSLNEMFMFIFLSDAAAIKDRLHFSPNLLRKRLINEQILVHKCLLVYLCEGWNEDERSERRRHVEELLSRHQSKMWHERNTKSLRLIRRWVLKQSGAGPYLFHVICTTSFSMSSASPFSRGSAIMVILFLSITSHSCQSHVTSVSFKQKIYSVPRIKWFSLCQYKKH